MHVGKIQDYNIIESGIPRNVINNDNPKGATKVAARYSTVSLLPSRVPNLQLEYFWLPLVIHSEEPLPEFHPHGVPRIRIN
jgi:hypothetical protein